MQEDLISSFVGIDARGHAKLVEEALDFMEREAPREAECYLCLQGLRRDFLFDCGRDEAALELGRRDLAQCQRTGSKHHLYQSLLAQCEIEMNAPWPLEALLDAATLTEQTVVVPVKEGLVSVENFLARARQVEAMARQAQQVAREIEDDQCDAEIEMWLAHTGFLLERDDAQTHFKRALDLFLGRQRMPNEAFFRTWMMTYWRLGSPEQALRLIEDETGWIAGHGQIAREARLARQACHFKLILGTLEAPDIAAAREKIARLGSPQHETERLDELEIAWKNHRAEADSANASEARSAANASTENAFAANASGADCALNSPATEDAESDAPAF